MGARELAAEVIAVLDLQQSYFKSRDTNALAQSKAAEAALRKTCKAILAGKPPGAGDLFAADVGGES